VIEAAGGVVWRRSAGGALEVLLVHRPRYDDWSFPKGKLEADEAAVEAALREVLEETGLACELGPELAEVRYVDHHGRDKRSRYWAMHPEDPDGPGAPDDEVDELRWLALGRARSQLSYEHDGVVLDALERLDPA
jgi:8-oxo-dGTP pyrophosphatase MutT (NUDIX family)